MKINKQKLFKKYMAEINKISEKCEDKSHFTPKEIVDIISDLLEKEDISRLLEEEGLDKNQAVSESKPRSGKLPPPSKKGWNHSEQVLVYYKANPELDRTWKWSIAYYHHAPPFDEKPHWVDFNTGGGTPDYWWPLPTLS